MSAALSFQRASEWCSNQSVGFVLRSEAFWILSNYRLPSLFYLATGILKTLWGQCCSWLSLLTCIQFDVLHYILWALYHRHHGARSILKKELAGEKFLFLASLFYGCMSKPTLRTSSNYLPKCSITERVKNNINNRKAIFFTALSADMKVKFRL